MDLNGLLSTLLKTDSDRIEWKESDREAPEAVCALANDLGNTGETGWLLLGVDKRGQVKGVDVSDEARQRLTNRLRSTKIQPHPSVDFQIDHHSVARRSRLR